MPRSERNDLESPRYRGSAPALAEQEASDSEDPQTGQNNERLVADESVPLDAVSTNNDAPCNEVAPSGKQSTNGEVVRCSDHETGVDLAFASSQQLEAGSCLSDDPVTRCTDAPMFDLPDALMSFLGTYLACTEQQRLVLALWIIHTHCLAASDFSPSLDVRSFQKQSGKSLCLQLLSLLCHKPALTTGFSTAVITDRLHGHHLTVLLDDREATLGSLNRSKNPALRAVLAGGFQQGIGYSDQSRERRIYSPKAFAGRSKLPEALADRSIPIDLKPKKPGDSVSRFRRSQVQVMAASLLEWLQQLAPWAIEHLQDAPVVRMSELIGSK